MGYFGYGTSRENMREWLLMVKDESGMSWPQFIAALSEVLTSFAQEMVHELGEKEA